MSRLLFICLFLLVNFVSAQRIVPELSARVDTSQVAIKAVYQLYSDYLNAQPDSLYRNPYWNEKEIKNYSSKRTLHVERSADLMYTYYDAKTFLSYYQPKVLQIDSVAPNRYQIKTLFAKDCSEQDYKRSTPFGIVKLYAVRNATGVFKLENVLNYDTRNWKKYQEQFIHYVVHPEVAFNRKEALNAVAFCKRIAEQFDLKITPFTFYLLPNTDAMGKLYNFEYWLSYLGGQTVLPNREIFTTYGHATYPHEFVHMLFPMADEASKDCPMLINEGLATWLGGPSYNESFEEALSKTAKVLQKEPAPTFDDIVTFKIRNPFDNSIFYVTGGVICKMVFEKKGVKGVWQLYGSTTDNYKQVISELLEKSAPEWERDVIQYIKNSFKN